MMGPTFETIGVAPMLPAGPCFATPIFRTERSNSSWYQKISSDQTIERFEEVDGTIAEHLTGTHGSRSREIGQPALFAYVSEGNRTYVGERQDLSDLLYAEYSEHR